MQAPKIDTRTVDGLLKTLEAKAVETFPDWQPKAGDAGPALMCIYAHMAEEVINRLNKVPQKQFTAFLDMLGISLLPADAAKAPLTFFLSEGAETHVLIPKGTPVSAGEENVAFETQTNMWATPAQLIYVVPVNEAIYLGFDKKIQKGPVSIYFSVEQQEHAIGSVSGLSIYYPGDDGQWIPLKIVDHTRNMSESGTVELFVPPDFVKTSLPYEEEWEDLYWLKVVKKGEGEAWQRIKAVYVNTTMAAQMESIADEILGSSDGSAGQEFFFGRAPVISEKIWVDETGKDTEAPIQWQAVDDFFASTSRNRHYVTDRARGSIRFGNGVQGMIPPAGRDNIKASYQTGGGKKGNVDAFDITDLKTSIPYLDRIENPEPARGGGDTEQMPDVIKRGPYLIKHRNRAVTREDFERMAAEVSGSIARARAVLKDNRLTLIIIPRDQVDKPLPSPVLLKEVKDRIIKHSINTLSPDSIVVQEPRYVEVSIEAGIFPVSYEEAPLLETKVIEKLREFLHPLTGGPEKQGWEFGRDLHISDVYALLESIEGVDHATNLQLNGKEEDVAVNEYQTLCSGTPRIEIRGGRGLTG